MPNSVDPGQVVCRRAQDNAEAIRQACLNAALAAYEEAGVLGLCQDGRWEAAISAIQSLDLRDLSDADEPGGAV